MAWLLVVVFVEGKVVEEVSVVRIRASSSAFLDGMKGFEEGFGADGRADHSSDTCIPHLFLYYWCI